MIVRPETAIVRPFIVCGILRGLNFDKHRYDSFIDLQVCLEDFIASFRLCKQMEGMQIAHQ